jgi:hypothetical protein
VSKLYDVKVTLAFQGPLEKEEWHNNWNVQGPDAPTVEQYTDLAGAFSAFHRGLLFDFYTVDRVTISTTAKDSKPYNPANLFVFGVGLPGLETPAGTVLPLTDCIDVRKVAVGGRNGHLFIRGGLSTDNVTSTGGVPRLSNPTTLATALETAFNLLATDVGPDWTIGIVTKSVTPFAFRAVGALAGPVLTASSVHRPRKVFASPSDPITQMAHIFEQAKVGADVVNTIVEVFNALPVLPDVPLLPG